MVRYTNNVLSLVLMVQMAAAPQPVSAWTTPTNLFESSYIRSRSSRHLQLHARPSYMAGTTDTDDLLQKMNSSPDNAAASTEQSTSSIQDMLHSADSFITSLTSSVNKATTTTTTNTATTSPEFPTLPNEQIATIVRQSIDAVVQNTKSIDDALLSNPTIGPMLSTIQSKLITNIAPLVDKETLLSISSLPPSVGILSSAVITYSIVSTVLSFGEDAPPSSPYPLGRYDPKGARVYFDGRLSEVIGRGIEIGSQSLAFGLSILSDKVK